MLTVTPEERERAKARSRRMFETDLASDMATSEAIGEKRGRKEGMKEGMKEGRKEGALAIAQNLLRMKIPLDQIVTATGLTREEVENLSD